MVALLTTVTNWFKWFC